MSGRCSWWMSVDAIYSSSRNHAKSLPVAAQDVLKIDCSQEDEFNWNAASNCCVNNEQQNIISSIGVAVEWKTA